jgi:adenosylhomocysteine nucleosidase
VTADHLAFVCAMPMELRPITRALSLRSARIGGIRVRTGTLGDRPVVAVATGMGTARATAATERLLDAVPVDRVVVVGITGAIDDDTPIATVVVPEVVVDSASGVAHRPAPLPDFSPQGTMWSTDELLTDPEVLAGLRDRGVVSLDMETAAIASVCEGRGVPWSVVRAISDRATDGSVDAEVFALSRPDGTPDPRAVVRYLLRHPGRVPGLVRMARGADRARRAAADAAIGAF